MLTIAETLRAKLPGAIRRALMRSATTVRAEMARLIVQEIGLPVGKVKDEIRLVDLGGTEVQFQLKAGKRIPLIQFGARGPEPSRGRGQGVTYKLGSGRGRAPKAFIATMPSGHRGVFQRREGADRLPIIELHGPAIHTVFEKYAPMGAARAKEILQKNLEHEIEFALGR
jgi:hypothetical protein